MTGRTVVVTGASSGVGAAAAAKLAARGATVAVVGRSPQRTVEVAERIGAEPFVADFARLDDVRELAGRLLDRYPVIDVRRAPRPRPNRCGMPMVGAFARS
ncbi:SDR family NAD(P)-dependent oxidoreductase [Nocardia sp. CA2R105]|nr:SDR family NAD(P)-dependent oxidoreductase [Nocardia coffeae]